MWYPVTIAAPAVEPVSQAEAKQACRVDADETYFDDELDRLVAVARAHVEARCAVRFAEREAVELVCDGFADLARLPEAPASVTAIEYVDSDGAIQTLSTDVYEVRASRLETEVVLKYGQAWPSQRPGSRITVTADVGASECPDDVKQAMLYIVTDMFEHHGAAYAGDWSTVDSLLINHTRNA